MVFSAPGGDLQKVIDDDNVPFEADVVKFIHHVVEGLAYMHQRKIAHLDIKVSAVVKLAHQGFFNIFIQKRIKQSLKTMALVTRWFPGTFQVQMRCAYVRYTCFKIHYATHEQTNGRRHDLDFI